MLISTYIYCSRTKSPPPQLKNGDEWVIGPLVLRSGIVAFLFYSSSTVVQSSTVAVAAVFHVHISPL